MKDKSCNRYHRQKRTDSIGMCFDTDVYVADTRHMRLMLVNTGLVLRAA